jgi:hypothetical protein
MSNMLARKSIESSGRRQAWPSVLASMLCASIGLLPSASRSAAEISPPITPSAAAIEQLTEIMVEAPEPRYVSPTRRDQIGRIWAPVMINGHGPVILRGVTGSATVPTIHVDTLTVGDLAVDSPTLPIVPDALGGAQGILGAEGLSGKRIFIDFRHDKISITFSHNERSGNDFVDVPFHSIRNTLVVVNAMVGTVRTKAIIDTGGQATIANLALRDALANQTNRALGRPDQIIGATKDAQDGVILPMPAIEFGKVHIADSGVTFADMVIFKQWHLTNEPAILIGMDALGLLDTLVIDYRRHELQMRMPGKG